MNEKLISDQGCIFCMGYLAKWGRGNKKYVGGGKKEINSPENIFFTTGIKQEKYVGLAKK